MHKHLWFLLIVSLMVQGAIGQTDRSAARHEKAVEDSLHYLAVIKGRPDVHFRDPAGEWRAPDQNHRVLEFRDHESGCLLFLAKHHRNPIYLETVMRSLCYF